MAEITRAELFSLIHKHVSVSYGGAELLCDAILARLGDGWRPITEAKTIPGHITVRVEETYRWLPYKPDGQRQMGSKGRWQKATLVECGAVSWANLPLPKDAEFKPLPPKESA